MSVTIYDVAQKAGVSITTVSRILNNEKGVKPSTKEKVLSIIEEMDYHPNTNASGLSKNKSNTIGALLPQFDDLTFPDSFSMTFLVGVQHILERYNYNLLLLNSKSVESKSTNSCMNVIKGKKIDGLIAFGNDYNYEFLNKVNDMEFPVVTINEDKFWGRWNNIVIDWNTYYDLAIAELVKYGHKNIAVVFYSKTEDRINVIKKVFDKYGLKFDKNSMINGAYERDVYTKIRTVLEKRTNTAFLGDSAYYARRISEAAKSYYINIPEDLSVMCFEYIEDEASRANPPITSLLISGINLGELCSKMLFEAIEGEVVQKEPMEETIFKVNIIDRNSIMKK